MMSDTLKEKIYTGLICAFLAGFAAGYFISSKTGRKIVHVDFSGDNAPDGGENARYPFLPGNYSAYTEELARELKIDGDLAVSILMVENPEFNPDAAHRNPNGSNDLGLWQLNDVYIYSAFVKSYWDMDVEFNPYNWKHSTFIAMHHIEYLLRTLKVQDDAVMAYNCGMKAVMNGRIPESTRKYLARVKNNMKILKQTEDL
jgi:hypothetical protein